MDKKSDFFQKKISNTRSFNRQKKKTSFRIIAFIILLILVCWFFCWQIFWKPVNVLNVENENRFSIWENLALQWNMKANWDIVTYTHTLQGEDWILFGLKSTELNLFDYDGYVELTGMVEKYNKEIPIIRVLQLSGSIVKESEDIDIAWDEQKWAYIMSAWMYFLPTFFDDYFLLNDWENWEVKIQNIESWENITINYFRCNSSDPNRNCEWLKDTFANTAVNSFITSEWDTYYKLSEVQSWYVSNWNWWWIFMNDIADDIVYDLKDKIKFANVKNVNEWLKSRAVKLCKWSWDEMQKITESEIVLKQEWLIAVISWNGNEKRMTCQILIDFALPEKWILNSLTIWDDVVEEFNDETVEQKVEENVSNIPVVENTQVDPIITYWNRDSNVEQFPIKAEWGLIYNSTRWWYSLQFPSSNISYSASAVKENFWYSDLSCSYVINVIKYSEKENLEISPSIRIYECNAKSDISSWSQEYAIKKLWEKLFVVQINDPSWIDFVNNLRFNELW